MKNTKLFVISTALLTASFTCVILGQNSGTKNKTEAYSTSSLPTTINLNDTSSSDIRDYYSALSSLSASERQGTNLLKNLKPILKKNQKYYSYDSGSAIWQIYEISDRDWVKSPASGTTYGTYNSLTNTITGYTYGTSNSNGKNNPYLHALYVNRDVENETRAWGNHNQNQWGINREHVWPKSQGFEATGDGGARGDPMHLWSGNGRVNGTEHNNYYYGFVDTSKSYKDPYNEKGWENLKNNFQGTSLTLGSGTVFEPQDCDKGDIARAIFYMVARYNYLSGSDSDGIDTNNPNLELVQSASKEASFTSTTSRAGKMGILTDLLEWNRLDPPDEWEIHRNNLLYTNYTNNRNPFIDFPEWAEYIWGSATYVDRNYSSYSSTPTGSANPATDKLFDFSDGVEASVAISDSSLMLGEDESATISATSSDDSTITWTSSNTSVATVSSASSASGAEITISAVSDGNATITASATIGGNVYSDTCLVTVSSAGTFGDATRYSGALTEGDYVIVYNLKAMKAGVSSSRFMYSNVTITDDTISNPADNLVWHIAPSDDSWTIYNAKTNKYASSNGTKNQGRLQATADEYSLWSASGTSTYDFVNDYNSDHSVNAYLRNNGSYGFACYSSGTGGALSLYKIATSSSTSITATVSRSYSVGETISKSDITVIDNNDNVINDFTFASDGYQFTYSDAPSGGSNGEKAFTITYNELETTLTVDVHRDEYIEPDTETISFTKSDFEASNVSHSKSTPSNTNVTINEVPFVVTTNAYIYYSELSFGQSDGYIYNRDAFERDIKSFTFAVYKSARTDGVQYISRDGLDWEEYSELECAKGGYRYFKIAYIGTDTKYSNITDIDIVLVGEESPINVANFIMFEDTNNQCETKFDEAVILFSNMTSLGRSTFMTSSDYVISTARTRFEAWAINQGKSIDLVAGDYVVNSAFGVNQITNISYNESTGTIIIIAVITLLSITSIAYFLIKKKSA